MHIQPIIKPIRIYKAKLLSSRIAEICLREIIFQPCINMIDVIVVSPEVQQSRPSQVKFNLLQTKLGRIEAYPTHLPQHNDKRIRSSVYTLPVNPYQVIMI